MRFEETIDFLSYDYVVKKEVSGFFMSSYKDIYHAAIYLRISRDDGDKAESDSIHNQRALLQAYIEKNPDIELTKEFVDDGYSGTNFERPGFQEMIDLAQNGTINCIIVKDLSRLGRNYIETGRLIDQIFPLLNIRFISVNDRFDSFSDNNDADQIIVPFKNLINDAYCRDISMKIRSQLDVKRKNGQFVGAWAAYGYRKDPEDKSHLVIDEKAADIVRMIFDMKLSGYSQTRIAEKLNEMGVLTPLEYKRSQGLNCNVGFWKGDNPRWVAPMITRILTNEIYIGNMVQGKMRKVNYKVKKLEFVDKKDWIRVTGTHEALVSRAVFDRVQELLQLDTRTSPNKETVELFAGILRCADCGQNMTLRTRRRGDKAYHYYYCSTAKAGRGCSYHSINADKLERVVLSVVQNQVRLLLDVKSLMDKTEHLPLKSHREKVLCEQIKTMDDEITRYQQMRVRLGADYKEGVIDQNDYEELKQKFIENIEKSKQIKDTLVRQKDETSNEPILPPEWLAEIRDHGQIEKLTRRLVIMLIDRILIYDKNNIEVVFRYNDEIQELVSYFKPDLDGRRVVLP